MGAYAGAARRRVHLATVLLRPPSGHRSGRRQARHLSRGMAGLTSAWAEALGRVVLRLCSDDSMISCHQDADIVKGSSWSVHVVQ